MLRREDRISRVVSRKPFSVLDNRVNSLLSRLIEVASALPYHIVDGDRDGYWDELFPAVKKALKEGHFEPDGYMEPAQALLAVFTDGLYRVTESFNERWNKLPEWYWKDIAGILPRPVLPGKIWFSFEKKNSAPERVEKGTAFYQEDKEGNRLYYRLEDDLVVENVEIAHISSLLYERNPVMMPAGYLHYITALRYQYLNTGVQKQNRMFEETTGLAKAVGIIISHPALLLREGKRTVTLFLLSETNEWREELERITDVLKVYFTDWSREKIIYEVFNSIFYLTISTEDGWKEVEEYTIKIEKESLKIQFTLIEEFPSTTACRENVHQLETPEPSLRIYPNLDAWLYPYSWLSLFRLQKIILQTQVENARNLLLYNELGRIDNSVPFQPFGVNAGKGSWLVAGNYEMACKSKVRMNLHIQWGELPEDEEGLAGYYREYGKGITNRSFRLQASYLSDYNWCRTDNQDTFYLFSSTRTQPDGTPLPNAPLASVSHLYTIQTDRMPPVRIPEEEYDYSIRSREGFIRLTLQEPAMGFGEKEYYRLFPLRMMQSQRKKKQTEWLNPPLFPRIERISADYSSEDVIDLQEPTHLSQPFVYQLYPLGRIPATSILHTLDTDASLFIALRNVQGGELLSLFFNFQPGGKECSHKDLPQINWYWGNGYSWEEVFPEAVIEDTTFHFMTSGVMKIRLPATLLSGQYDKNGYFWLRAGVKKNAHVIPYLCSIHLNAGQLVRDLTREAGEYVPDSILPYPFNPKKISRNCVLYPINSSVW
ncbi:MAG: hypothetical protein LIP01_14305 [Tannerellaceae bacterium]|nr:hypothetical protein [Tannerellaceae bacterium]